MKRDLDFATSEIERLRAKLVIDDDATVPPLADELFGIKDKGLNMNQRSSNARDHSIDIMMRVENINVTDISNQKPDISLNLGVNNQ